MCAIKLAYTPVCFRVLLLASMHALWSSLCAQVTNLYLMNEPLCWSSIQIGTFLFAKDGISRIASVSLIVLLQRCLPTPYLAITGAVSGSGSNVLMGFARSDLMLYMGTLTETLSLFPSASSSCLHPLLIHLVSSSSVLSSCPPLLSPLLSSSASSSAFSSCSPLLSPRPVLFRFLFLSSSSYPLPVLLVCLLVLS